MVNTLPISANFGSKLQILVESQGRINFNIANDFKGILGDVKLGGSVLRDWTITGYPLDNYDQIANLLEEGPLANAIHRDKTKNGFLMDGPTVFRAKFDIAIDEDEIQDTYLNPTGWGKVISSIQLLLKQRLILFDIPGSCFYQRIQSRPILANGWTANHSLFAQRVAEKRRE